jgi:hypothetical protein
LVNFWKGNSLVRMEGMARGSDGPIFFQFHATAWVMEKIG